MTPEQLAILFHDSYELLAPTFGYETREASAKPWDEVPEHNRKLMIATSRVVLEEMHKQEDVPLINAARNMVYAFVCDHLEKTDTHPTFGPDEVYVVWFCKVLQNWKALVSTTLPDGMYYEITFDGDKQKVYIDAYKKFENRAFDFIM